MPRLLRKKCFGHKHNPTHTLLRPAALYVRVCSPRLEPFPAVMSIPEPRTHLSYIFRRSISNQVCPVPAQSPRVHPVSPTLEVRLVLWKQLYIVRLFVAGD